MKRYIDLIALYKTQPAAPAPRRRSGMAHRDQVVAEARRASAEAREVGGGAGGFYTQAQYADIVALRARSGSSRSFPRSTCRATPTRRSSSYAELNCNGTAPEPYTGTDGGLQRVVRREGRHVHVHRRRRARDRGADAGAVLPHRRRRGEDADAGAVHAFIERVAGDRRSRTASR